MINVQKISLKYKILFLCSIITTFIYCFNNKDESYENVIYYNIDFIFSLEI